MTPVAASSPVLTAKPVDPALRKAAEAFEAVILREMLATMRKAKLGDELFGSSATDNFRELADARTADSMATLRQFGIADLVERQLTSGAQNLTQPVRAEPVEAAFFTARINKKENPSTGSGRTEFDLGGAK
ncbi:peptidoglycan hydrolase [Nostoc sp. HG1]|nr:peptidoglycan hydrolase [Nostoc sp. HG1]